ncbi:MAG TPA: hypothetical protein ENK93_02980 [Campylobacteraceae bacterium]|nr:hypothetical protein [Campylobacteraceae bacterium]
MNTIIMLFSLPIGIFLLLREKKAMQAYRKIFDDFFEKVKADTTLSKKEKLDLLEEMLYQNGYQITEKDDHHVRGEKKIFSIGWLFAGLGTLYIGLIVYVLYYLYFQKPYVIEFHID